MLKTEVKNIFGKKSNFSCPDHHFPDRRWTDSWRNGPGRNRENCFRIFGKRKRKSSDLRTRFRPRRRFQPHQVHLVVECCLRETDFRRIRFVFKRMFYYVQSNSVITTNRLLRTLGYNEQICSVPRRSFWNWYFITYTVKPVLTTTCEEQPPVYYDHLK